VDWVNSSSFGFQRGVCVSAKPNVLECAVGFLCMAHNALAMASAGF